MPDLADAFAILQTLDYDTLLLVKMEIDRMLREKQHDRNGHVEAANRQV